jgi:hypothetical protein
MTTRSVQSDRDPGRLFVEPGSQQSVSGHNDIHVPPSARRGRRIIVGGVARLQRFDILSYYGIAMLPIVPVQPGGGG